MATPAVLDFARLLAPLNGDHRAVGQQGANGEREKAWSEMVFLRNQAGNEEKLIDNKDPLNPGDPEARDSFWKQIAEQAETGLAEESKDLNVAAYLIEARTRSDGFAGLRDGLKLARELVEQYWDSLYPPAPSPLDVPSSDPGSAEWGSAEKAPPSKEQAEQAARSWRELVERRLGALASLNGRRGDGSLVLQIKRLPLTKAGPDGEFSYLDFVDVNQRSKSTNDATRESGQALSKTLEDAAQRSSDDFLLELRDTIAECRKEFDGLTVAIETRAGLKTVELTQVFPTSNIKTALAACLEIAAHNAKGRGPSEPETASGGSAPSSGDPRRDGPEGLANRTDALLTLESVARYFERTEPQSPLAPAIRQIVRWGRAPLAELYAELIPDSSSREAMFKLIGVQPPQEKS